MGMSRRFIEKRRQVLCGLVEGSALLSRRVAYCVSQSTLFSKRLVFCDAAANKVRQAARIVRVFYPQSPQVLGRAGVQLWQ